MTQEQKELLLKDLCARLPYGVKLSYRCNHIHILKAIHKSGLIVIDDTITNITTTTDVENIMPYLFPLSSMTEEQSKIYHELVGGMFGTSVLINLEYLIDFFNKNHFDYRGLIEKGLAVDATDKNIY